MSHRTETEKPPNRGQPIPSNTAKRVHKSAKPRAVKVGKDLPIKKPAATAEKIAVYTSGKAENSKTANQHGDCGSAQIQNPVKLTLKERKALELVAFQGLDARQAKFVDLWLVTYNGAQAYRDAGYSCKTEAGLKRVQAGC